MWTSFILVFTFQATADLINDRRNIKGFALIRATRVEVGNFATKNGYVATKAGYVATLRLKMGMLRLSSVNSL